MKKLILTILIIHFSLLIADAQWTIIYDSTNNPVESFADNGNILYAAVAGNGVYKTTNYGVNWILSNNNISTQSFNNICAKDSFVFIASNYGLFRSTDYGITWDSLESIFGTAFSVIIMDSCVFVGMLNGIHRSSDWGNTWVTINNGFPSSFPDGKSLTYYGNVIYAGIWDNYKLLIYKSTNYGNNWIYISQDIPTNNIPYSLYACENLLLCGTATGVYKSTNAGTNWEVISGIPGNIGLFGFASVGTKNIFISAWIYGVYVSNDYGQTFTQRNEGLSSLYSTALYKFGDYLFLGTNYYTLIFRRTLSEVVAVKNISSEIPDSYKLSQNYPNPFNPVTNIKYQMPKDGFVTLKIYDITGREIAKLVNEQKQAGYYTVTFNGSNFASGVYFYRIQAGDFVQVKRMMLIK